CTSRFTSRCVKWNSNLTMSLRLTMAYTVRFWLVCCRTLV
ncbi:ATP-dependent helicase HrpA, partial [Vibrio parahaemolyticus VPTS-2010]